MHELSVKIKILSNYEFLRESWQAIKLQINFSGEDEIKFSYSSRLITDFNDEICVTIVYKESLVLCFLIPPYVWDTRKLILRN